MSLWQPWYTETLTWLGGERCATDLVTAEGIATAEGVYESKRPRFERLNAAYDEGKWYTLREEGSEQVVRVVDCAMVSGFVPPDRFGLGSLEGAFIFARPLDVTEVLQLALEIEAHRWTDGGADDGLVVVAFGAEESAEGVVLASCAAGQVEGNWHMEDRRYLYDTARWELGYRATRHELP